MNTTTAPTVRMTAAQFVERYSASGPVVMNAEAILAIVVWADTERWLDAFLRVTACLRDGVAAVVFLHPATRIACVYSKGPPYPRGENDILTLPDVLPGFAVPVARFFE